MHPPQLWRALAWSLGLAFVAGCAGAQAPRIQVEQQPRTILRAAVGSPSIAFGSGGDLELLTAVDAGDHTVLRAFASRNGGDTFVDRGPVSLPSSDVTFAGEDRPRFVMDRDEVLYAVWRQGGMHSSNVVVASHDWRQPGFTKPVAVRDVRTPGFNGFANIAAGPDGAVYAVWLDERDSTKGADWSSVYFARSTDHGASFEKNVRVATHTCGCCSPAVAVGSDGRIYVAWRHDYDDVRDIAVASSNDGGKTFTAATRVAQDGWHLHGCPESGPSVMVDGNRVYVAWFTVGSQSRPRVQASWSDDHGKTFTAPVELSQGILDANHPTLFAGKPDGVWAVFQGRSPLAGGNWSPIRAFVTRVDRPGQAVALDTPTTQDQEYPFAVMRDSQSLFVGLASAGHAIVLRGRVIQ